MSQEIKVIEKRFAIITLPEAQQKQLTRFRYLFAFSLVAGLIASVAGSVFFTRWFVHTILSMPIPAEMKSGSDIAVMLAIALFIMFVGFFLLFKLAGHYDKKERELAKEFGWDEKTPFRFSV